MIDKQFIKILLEASWQSDIGDNSDTRQMNDLDHANFKLIGNIMTLIKKFMNTVRSKQPDIDVIGAYHRYIAFRNMINASLSYSDDSVKILQDEVDDNIYEIAIDFKIGGNKVVKCDFSFSDNKTKAELYYYNGKNIYADTIDH